MAGPFAINFSNNQQMYRSNIAEGAFVYQMNLNFQVVDIGNNCTPIPNAQVHVWHANPDGYYSGFANQTGYLGTQSYVGQTFYRGIQLTNNLGYAFFQTDFPGWYPGRAAHVHFQVYVSSMLAATSQMAFPDTFAADVNALPPYNLHGQNPTTNAIDFLFSDTANTQYELPVLTQLASGGWDATLVVGIDLSAATGLRDREPETGGQFKLGINHPNPFTTTTAIPLELHFAAEVSLDIYDQQGRPVQQLSWGHLPAGVHALALDLGGNVPQLAAGGYVYQLTTENENGVFRQCKLMTVA
jgi:protocatechuate 3,4-dioxygenase beta subunit